MIIGLSGLAGSGKDTSALYLIEKYSFRRLAFADILKKFCYLINPELREAVDTVGWNETKRIPVYRRFLQDVGHNARLTFGMDFWVDQVLSKQENFTQENIVITDVRYENEFERVLWHDGWTVRINRPGLKMVNNHITETQHLNMPVSFEIVNETIKTLHLELDRMMDAIYESN